MVITDRGERGTVMTSMEDGDDRASAIRLWAVVAGDHQFGGIHRLRLQLRQAQDIS
ncbi:hypothetical protein CBM2598_P120001 [Cupriavidus taiwanensis]|uniref:Uncharacterized protein n=1 Tax=Cupriavidus taiwanensis TaxID=164546 RepID=A0A7Z7NQH9_9BURK|nr:hypothetical protein CBM2598_P120001 [Cupriavidus taiwanensis]SPC25107.1 hypothetical protein CBM2594_P100001 [Cupriavidus taiwanensis]